MVYIYIINNRIMSFTKLNTNKSIKIIETSLSNGDNGKLAGKSMTFIGYESFQGKIKNFIAIDDSSKYWAFPPITGTNKLQIIGCQPYRILWIDEIKSFMPINHKNINNNRTEIIKIEFI